MKLCAYGLLVLIRQLSDYGYARRYGPHCQLGATGGGNQCPKESLMRAMAGGNFGVPLHRHVPHRTLTLNCFGYPVGCVGNYAPAGWGVIYGLVVHRGDIQFGHAQHLREAAGGLNADTVVADRNMDRERIGIWIEVGDLGAVTVGDVAHEIAPTGNGQDLRPATNTQHGQCCSQYLLGEG